MNKFYNLPASRSEARKQRFKHYYTGKPCKYGHIDARSSVDGNCMECKRLRYHGEPLTGSRPRTGDLPQFDPEDFFPPSPKEIHRRLISTMRSPKTQIEILDGEQYVVLRTYTGTLKARWKLEEFK